MELFPNVEMIEKMGYQNVVSKKFLIDYKKLDEYLEKFSSGISNAGYTLKGPFFYAINNVPLEKMIDVEIFSPIYENIFELEGYKFLSYFELTNLFKSVVDTTFPEMTEIIYAELLATIKKNLLEIQTPFYHFLPTNGLQYMNILIGYMEETKETRNKRLDEESFGF